MNIDIREYTVRQDTQKDSQKDKESFEIPPQLLQTQRSKTPLGLFNTAQLSKNKSLNKLFQQTIYISPSSKGMLKLDELQKNQARELNNEKSLLMRINKLQQINSVLKKDLLDKANKIDELEREVSILKTLVEEEHLEHYNCVLNQSEKLKQENKEMKQFLEDYGFKWLGSIDQMKTTNADEKKKLFEIMKKDYTTFQDPMFKNQQLSGVPSLAIEEIKKKVEELNKKSEKQYAKRQNGTAIIDKDKPLLFHLFRNGLKLGSLPYYPYFSKEGQEILSDIYDGFFPTRLKGKYFECTPIIVMDETNLLFVPQMKKIMQKAMTDEETSLNSVTKRLTLSRLRKVSSLNMDSLSARDSNFKPSPKMESKIPTISPAPPQKADFAPELIEVETEIYKIMKEHAVNTFPRENLVEITVKTENKKRQLLIKMGKKETIARLFDYVYVHRETMDVKNRDRFELRTIFPLIKLKHNDNRTLEELGFVQRKSLGFYLLPPPDKNKEGKSLLN
ncbi:ubx domain-containing protein 11 [Stylonychia lemnae]|uniref:Ubx domain-containing protein 11 n=1 Tax=Stylonychia lemnae TaxID=5949 RepID=A0A078B0Y6_STYLE|nr:ubx domain-containing protein 11 [Stylonychia lemnae]|eukprot:CDW87017.1 ubx domain-containing protein 11 [Stylonychia lemnae]